MAVQAAKSAEEVVRILHDYVQAWTPDEVAKLPSNCRPELPLDAPAIAAWAVHFVQCELKFTGPPDAAGLLQRTAHLFVLATNRIHHLTLAR